MSRRQYDLGTMSRSRASRAAFAILDAVQNEPLEYMVASVGLVLEAIVEVKGLSRGDLMTTVANMLRAEGLEDDQYVTALRNFIKNEVPDA